METIQLNNFTEDKRYKVLNNCSIYYSSCMNCLVACIEAYDRDITDNIVNSIYSFIQKNAKDIYIKWNKLNNDKLRVYSDNEANFIQIDVFR